MWEVVVTLERHRCVGRSKPPFDSPHPALGWPLVRFSSRSADDGFSESSTTSMYLDPEGWFTLTEKHVEEDWMEGRFFRYVGMMRGRERKPAFRE